jgi:hypothetical protein
VNRVALIEGVVEIVGAAFAVTSAIFWWLSAYGKLPPMVTYWGGAPESDPFFQALKFSAQMNKWAAGFSGATALCAAASLFLRRLSG